MASTQATIDLVVRGSGAVNRLIENVNQLQSAVDRINSRTLDVASKNLNDRARDISRQLRNDIGTARDPRPEVASRVTELTRRQTQATREYERAVSSQSRALAGAVRAEEQLAERRQRRTRVDSNAEREIVDRLNRNVAAYRAAEGEVSQLLGRFRSLSREFAAIGRMNAEARIPLINELINVNQTANIQRSVRALAQEFNRLGDSARSSNEENRLSRTDLPNQIRNFGQLSDRLAETRARAQALREELVAIGRNERLVRAPAASPIILGESQGVAEMIQALRNQPSEVGISRQNQEIAERNRARQRRRSEIRTELSQQNTLIGQIEAEALTAGDAVFNLQNRLASLVEFRYRDEPTAGRNISLNQIQAQAESLALVANNSSIATDAFRQFTVAAEMASIKLARSQQATFEALAAGLSTTGGVNIPEGLRQPELVAGARGMVAELIADIPNLTRSEAALGAHIRLLNQIRTLLPFLSLEYRAVEEAIAGLNEELQGVGLRGQASKIDPGAGQRLLRQREREENTRQKGIAAVNRLIERQTDIERRINESRFSAAEKDNLMLKNEEAFARLSNNELEAAKRLTSELERQVAAKEKLLKSKPAQVFGVEGFQFNPVTGKSKTGAITPGSPAAEEDALKALTKYTQEAERNAQKLQASYDRLDLTQALDEYLADIANVENAGTRLLKKLSTVPGTGESALKNFDKRLQAAVEGKRAGGQLSSQLLMLEKLQKRMLELEIDGVDVAQNKATVEKLIEDIKSGQISASKQSVDFVGKELRDARARLGISQSQAKIDGQIAASGPSKKINDLAAQQKYAAQVNDEYQKMEGLLAKIGGSTISDTQKLQLSLNVDQAINELYNDRLESAQLITREVEKQFVAEQRLAKAWETSGGPALPPSLEGNQKTFGVLGTSFMPISGKMPKGRAQLQIEEEQKALYQIEAQHRRLANLQLEYNKEEERGVTFLQEKAQLAATLQQLSSGQFSVSRATSEALGRDIKLFSDLKRQRVLEAQAAGEYKGTGGKKATTAEQLESRRERILKLAMSGASQLIDLETKGVVVTSERRDIEQTINDLQAIRNKSSEQELVTLAQKVQAARNFANQMSLGLKAGAIPGAGLQAALQQLQAARQARQEFLGTMSPAEGVSKIVQEFNTGKGDLARRATEAAQQGPQALLSLKELANPAKVSAKELEALSGILKEFRSVLDPTVEGFDRLDNQLRETAANLDRQLERRAPDANFLTRRFGPRTANAISEGLIGGAFPLLFGQGLGSSVLGGLGGALGGFAGGGLGFGLSLIGTGLGGAFDQLNQAAQETGKSLNYPIEGFEKLKEAGLFASRAQEYYISKLIESGQTAKATAEIQAEMIKKIGVSGVNDLMKLGDSSSGLSKAWAEFNLQLQAALAGPMAGLLEWVNKILDRYNEQFREEQKAKDIRAGLSPKDQRSFDILKGKTLAEKLFGIDLGPSTAEINRKFESRAEKIQVRNTKEDFQAQQQAVQAQRQAADEIKSAYREGFQLQQRIIDFERKAVDIRRRIEDEIFNKRQQIARQQIDNDRKRAQIAIESVDLEYQKQIANQEGRAAGMLAAEAEIVKTRAEGEANIEASKRQLELDIAKQQRESQNYIFNLSREADSIRRETLGLEMEVADYRETIERKIQDKRLIAAAGEKAAAEQAGRGAAAAGSVQVKGGYTGSSVDGFPITSRPGMRMHPVYGKRKEHKGVDIHAPLGTALGYEIAGKVISTALLEGYGKTLEVELDNGVTAFAAHLSEVLVKVGDKFKANQILAKVGSTGTSTGPHVHIEGREGGDPYAPLPFLQLGKAVSGKPSSDIYYQPGVGYFSRKTGRMVSGPADTQATTGAFATPIAQLEEARSQVDRRPVIPPVPVAGAAGAMQALDTEDNRIKRESVALEERLVKLKEQGMLQRLYEIARGPLELKQRRDALKIARAELYVTDSTLSAEDQAIAIFDAQTAARISIREEENRLEEARLKTSKLTKKEQETVIQKMNEGLEILRQQRALDREELLLERQIRFVRAKSPLEEEPAGFFGAAASAYTAEMQSSGNPAQAAELAQLTRMKEIRKAVADLRSELNSLTDPFNIATNAAGAIGGAFSESFKGIIDGSMSAQKALANFFQRTADHFLDMASQIITKWIHMTILNQAMQLFPSPRGRGLLDDFGGFTLPGFTMPSYMQTGNAFGFANGAMFNGPITPFAMGGAFSNSIVSSPTLFKFADGGVMRTGQMGEAGPEAIMPLTRGPGGRLGVDASGAGGGDVSVTVNVDARGTSVEGDQQQGAAFGRAISAVVQAEIVKQKRPGGLLSR